MAHPILPTCDALVREDEFEVKRDSVFDRRYWPGDSFADHLAFILRHEDTDLLVLKRIFGAVPQAEFELIEQIVGDAFEGFDEASAPIGGGIN